MLNMKITTENIRR